ncbi:MAG TPA: hypothetical protein VFF86_03590 [Candidatus Methylomirabilis sp.]|nr:hypothetical protein [Candidatus Methylomirabilis sp.]
MTDQVGFKLDKEDRLFELCIDRKQKSVLGICRPPEVLDRR